jgi:hypothetical protein
MLFVTISINSMMQSTTIRSKQSNKVFKTSVYCSCYLKANKVNEKKLGGLKKEVYIKERKTLPKLKNS